MRRTALEVYRPKISFCREDNDIMVNRGIAVEAGVRGCLRGRGFHCEQRGWKEKQQGTRKGSTDDRDELH